MIYKSIHPKDPDRSSVLVISAVCIGITLGQLGPITQPFQVGALIDGAHKTAVQAGTLIAIQATCYAVSLLAIAKITDRVNAALISLSGIVLSVVAFAVMYVASNLAPLTVATALAGVGQGVVFAGALAAGARTPNPERIYGVGATVAIVLSASFMAVIPMAREYLSARGVFAALCAALLLLAPALLGFGGTRRSTPEAIRSSVDRTGAAALLGLLVLFGIGVGSIYPFAERIGAHIGLDQEQIGFIFSSSTVAGAAGSILAAWVGLRWGRGAPLYVSLTATGCACLAVGCSTGAWSYAAGLMAFQIAYTASVPFQFGSAAGLDPGGRLSAFAGGVHFTAWAIGAQIGGFLAQYLSFNFIGLFALLMCLLAAVVVTLLVRAFCRLDQLQNDEHGRAPLRS